MHPSSLSSPRRASARARRSAAIALTAGLAGLAIPAAAGAALVASPSALVASPNAVQPAAVSALPKAEVEEVLSTVPLKDLSTKELGEVLAQRPGIDVLPQGPLREALESTFERLDEKGDTLGQLTGSTELVPDVEARLNELLSHAQLGELSSLLKGASLSSALSQALGSLEAGAVVGSLLSSAPEPELVLSQVLAAANPEKLATLVGSTLTGEPFVNGTIGELASDAGTTPEALASDLSTTVSQLPASAMALTAPLANGKTLGVLDGTEGVDLATLASGLDGGTGGSGSGASGGSGGPGGSGSSSPGTPTVIVNMAAQPSTTTGSSTRAKTAKITIVSRKVKGDVATLVVQVPAAGTLALTGKRVRPARDRARKAELLTLRAILTKAGTASLRRHHRRLPVKLTVAYAQTGVAGSSTATATVIFA
jgi:hypothetical protein